MASQSDRSPAEKPHWRTALTTEDKQKALDMAKEIGDKVRVEEIRYRWCAATSRIMPSTTPRSGGTISRDARLARDAMLGLMKTCRKLDLSFYHYLGDRLGISGKVIPSLAGLVAAKA